MKIDKSFLPDSFQITDIEGNAIPLTKPISLAVLDETGRPVSAELKVCADPSGRYELTDENKEALSEIDIETPPAVFLALAHKPKGAELHRPRGLLASLWNFVKGKLGVGWTKPTKPIDPVTFYCDDECDGGHE